MPKSLETLGLFKEKNSQRSTLSHSDRLVKILALLENVPGWEDQDQALSAKQLDSSMSADLVILSGKMLKERSPQTIAKTLRQSCKRLPTLGVIDLNGNCLIHAGYYPKTESGYSLSDILEEEVDQKYFLSEKMVRHILEVKPGQNQKPNFVHQSQQKQEKKTIS